MDKQSKVGYILTVDDALRVWTQCAEAEKAMGVALTRDEKEHLLSSMMLGKEVTLEELRELMAGKKVLVVKDKKNEAA